MERGRDDGPQVLVDGSGMIHSKPGDLMKHLLFAVIFAFLAQTLSAQDWAKARLEKSSRHGEWVEFKSGERTLKAFVVYPERKEKAPVVIVIHEIFGLTDWVRGVCDQLAEAGVIAIAPDMLSGQTLPMLTAHARRSRRLPKEQVKADLDATAEYALTKIPAASGALTVSGFCWGGARTFEYAVANPKLKAAYSFYGNCGRERRGRGEDHVPGLWLLRRE